MVLPNSQGLPVLKDVTFNIEIQQATNLVPKDRNLFGRKTSSDPYIEIYVKGKLYGKTKVKPKTLSPVWNETIRVKFNGGSEATSILQDSIHLCILDDDQLSASDPMGTVVIPCKDVLDAGNEGVSRWYPVGLGSGKMYCKNATGELQVAVSVTATRVLNLVPGNTHHIAGHSNLRIGLAWDMEAGRAVDLDASCVAISRSGQVLTQETVYYGNLENSNRSVFHSGDERSGETIGDDEVIQCQLGRIPQDVVALYFILNVVTPERTLQDIKSARVMVSNSDTRKEICQFVPHHLGNSTAMFLARLARDVMQPGQWTLSPIEEGHPAARDFGTLIPQIKSYSRDIIPDIVIDPNERVAVMRKNGVIRVKDVCPSGIVPKTLTFGLAWDITNGQNIDLDASIICLDQNFQKRDVVYYGQLRSMDGAIQHGGDEREGDEIGDDEKINIQLNQIHPEIHYLGVVVNSYSGQELDDVARASCHLFDACTGRDLAVYAMTNSKELDKHTALVMACFYRSGNEWMMRIISEAAMGKTAFDNIDELQDFLRRNPPATPIIYTEEEEEIDLSMPAHVPHNEEEDIEVLPAGALQQYADEEIKVAPISIPK